MLADEVGVVEWYLQYPGDVLYHRLGLHLVEGDDLTDPVLAVLLFHVIDDFLTPFGAEVDVHVRHFVTIRVKESLEEKIIFHGIEAGDSQAIRYHGPCGGTPSRSHGYVALFCVIDEVPHDQEVSGKPHVRDHGKLVIDALYYIIGDAPRGTFSRHLRTPGA